MGGWEGLEMVWRYVKAAEKDDVVEGRDRYYEFSEANPLESA